MVTLCHWKSYITSLNVFKTFMLSSVCVMLNYTPSDVLWIWEAPLPVLCVLFPDLTVFSTLLYEVLLCDLLSWCFLHTNSVTLFLSGVFIKGSKKGVSTQKKNLQTFPTNSQFRTLNGSFWKGWRLIIV